MELLFLLCRSFEPISTSCEENFRYFISFFNKTYDDSAIYQTEFCNNFESFLQIKNCSNCAITSVFDRSIAQLGNVNKLLYQPERKILGSIGTCEQYYCYAKDPLKQLSKAPVSVDLREWGLITIAKDQGGCGSCWCFGAIAALENAVLLDQDKSSIPTFQSNARNTKLSEQFFLRNLFNRAEFCDGENAVSMLNYVINSYESVELAANYPYNYLSSEALLFNKRVELPYKLDKNQFNLPFKVFPRVQISGIVGTPYTPAIVLSLEGKFNGEKVMSYLARGIAVITSMYTEVTPTSKIEFSSYDGTGIVNKYGCGTNNMNHEVVFIGYGKKDGKKVWLVRNSWGADWGNHGAFYVLEGNNDFCLETQAFAIIPKHYDANSGVFADQFVTPYQITRGIDGFDSDDGKFVNIEFKTLSDISIVSIVISVICALVVAGIATFIIVKFCKRSRVKKAAIVFYS